MVALSPLVPRREPDPRSPELDSSPGTDRGPGGSRSLAQQRLCGSDLTSLGLLKLYAASDPVCVCVCVCARPGG